MCLWISLVHQCGMQCQAHHTFRPGTAFWLMVEQCIETCHPACAAFPAHMPTSCADILSTREYFDASAASAYRTRLTLTPPSLLAHSLQKKRSSEEVAADKAAKVPKEKKPKKAAPVVVAEPAVVSEEGDEDSE